MSFHFALRRKLTPDEEQELLALREFRGLCEEILAGFIPESVRPEKPGPEPENPSPRVAIEKEVASTEPKDLPNKYKTESVVSQVGFEMSLWPLVSKGKERLVYFWTSHRFWTLSNFH